MRKEYLLLFGILLLAFFMRVFNLWKVPMYGDELTIVYDAYSLLKNGTDQLGNSFPITFPMGAGRPAGYVYGSIPFVALFGPSIWGVRLLSLISGIGLLLVVYFLAKGLELKKAALFAVLFAAIAPWAINLSRGGFESNFALFLALLGLTSLLYAKTKKWLLLVSAVSFSAVIHTYPTFKLTLPFVLLLFIWYIGGLKWLFSKKYLYYTIASIVILATASFISLHQTITAGSESRFAAINIFTEEASNRWLRETVSLERSVAEIPKPIAPLFHNRFLEYPVMYLSSYFRNLSVDFLFLNGDGNPRHNMAVTGTFYIVELLLILFGIYILIKSNRRVFLLLVGWILIAPLATAMIGAIHLLRNSFLFPPLLLFSAVGFIGLWEYRKFAFKKLLMAAVIIVFFAEFILFSERLFFVAPNEFSRFWSYPAKVAAEVVLENKEKYDYIFLSGTIENAEYGYLSYAKVDPKLTISQNQQMTKLNDISFKKFDNVYIGEIPGQNFEQFVQGLNGNVLYLTDIEQLKYIPDADVDYGTEGAPMFIMKEVINK